MIVIEFGRGVDEFERNFFRGDATRLFEERLMYCD